jgi:hypothetical protein
MEFNLFALVYCFLEKGYVMIDLNGWKKPKENCLFSVIFYCLPLGRKPGLPFAFAF